MQLSKISSGGSGVQSCSVVVAGSKVLRSQIYSADRRARGVLALRSLSRSLRGQVSLGSASGHGPTEDSRTVLPTIDSLSLSQRLRCPGRASRHAEFRAHQELLFQSAEDAARPSHMRYAGGTTGYLEFLTNDTNAFSAALGQICAKSERDATLRDAIGKLRPLLRNAVELYQLQELSLHETAKALGISTAALKGRLFHARAALRSKKELKAIRSRDTLTSEHYFVLTTALTHKEKHDECSQREKYD